MTGWVAPKLLAEPWLVPPEVTILQLESVGRDIGQQAGQRMPEFAGEEQP